MEFDNYKIADAAYYMLLKYMDDHYNEYYPGPYAPSDLDLEQFKLCNYPKEKLLALFDKAVQEYRNSIK